MNQKVTLGMLEVLGCPATAVENGRRAIDLLAALLLVGIPLGAWWRIAGKRAAGW